MPARPIRSAIISVVRFGILRFRHLIIRRLINVRCGIRRIARLRNSFDDCAGAAVGVGVIVAGSASVGVGTGVAS